MLTYKEIERLDDFIEALKDEYQRGVKQYSIKIDNAIWLVEKLKEINEDLTSAVEEVANLQEVKKQFDYRSEALLRCQRLVRKLQNGK